MPLERIVSDAGDAVRDRDAGQAGEALERIVSDAGDAVGNRVAFGCIANRVLDERGLALVEQDPNHTAICGINCIHCYRGQAGAVSERTVSDGGDAVADRDVGQVGAVIERRVSDAGDTVWDCDTDKTALRERKHPDAGNAVGNRNTGQAGAASERNGSDSGDAAGYRIGGSAIALRVFDERGLALVEQDSSNTAIVGIAWIHVYRSQAGA